jgi:hypothetical protein
MGREGEGEERGRATVGYTQVAFLGVVLTAGFGVLEMDKQCSLEDRRQAAIRIYNYAFELATVGADADGSGSIDTIEWSAMYRAIGRGDDYPREQPSLDDLMQYNLSRMKECMGALTQH